MNKLILHQNPDPLAVAIPASVRNLDAVLNRRVAVASTDKLQNHWLRVKVTLKRRLASLPDSQVDATARAILAEVGADDAAGQ